MFISNVGRCSINTTAKSIVLRNVLHVPKTSKNLIYVHKLTRDNDVFIEFHPDYFFFCQGSGVEEKNS